MVVHVCIIIIIILCSRTVSDSLGTPSDGRTGGVNAECQRISALRLPAKNPGGGGGGQMSPGRRDASRRAAAIRARPFRTGQIRTVNNDDGAYCPPTDRPNTRGVDRVITPAIAVWKKKEEKRPIAERGGS